MCYLAKLDGLEFRLLNTVYNNYYKGFWYIKEDLYFDAYIGILEYKKANPSYQEEDLFKVVSNRMSNFTNKFWNNRETVASLDKQNDLGTLLSDTISCVVGVDDILNYKFLFKLFYNFINCYPDTGIKKLYLDYYNGSTLQFLSDKYSLSIKMIINYIRKFRSDFSDYLVFCGYFSDFKNINDEFVLNKSDALAHKRYSDKVKGKEIDLNLYCYDFLICKLLRNHTDISCYSNCLGLSVIDLSNIINHKSKKKLTLYQIQKLRYNFFKDYTLEQLLSTGDL